MSRVTDINMKKEKSKIRFFGIGAAARELGVTRQHLWAVLVGQRTSKRLMAQYNKHKKG